jgi:hypothetical protein
MWKALVDAASGFLETERCEYYFVFLPVDPSQSVDENRRRQQHQQLLKAMGAKQFQFEMTVPDLSRADQTEVLVKHGIGLSARLAYKANGTGDAPDLSGVFHMAYELDYWWALTWTTQDLPASLDMIKYLSGMRQAVEARVKTATSPPVRFA